MKELTLSNGATKIVTDNTTLPVICVPYASRQDFINDFQNFTNENLSSITVDEATHTGYVLDEVRIFIKSDGLEVHYILLLNEEKVKNDEIEALRRELAELTEDNFRYKEGYDAYELLTRGLT